MFTSTRQAKEVFTRSQEIYLNKRFKTFVEPGCSECPQTVIATIQKNLENLGFIMSRALCDRLSTHTPEAVTKFYNETVTVLKKMVGAHKRYSPMYPNFPAQVMEASEAELYWNAMSHYLGAFISDMLDDKDFVVLPKYAKDEREDLDPEVETIRLRVIGLGNQEDFDRIFTNILAANSSIPQTDKDILTWFVQEYQDRIKNLLPDKIPQKETLSFVCGLALQHCQDATFLTKLIDTATDVLRVAVALSNGDVSLAADTKFRRFKRSERRFLLAALDHASNATEDMLRYPEVWKRLGRELRPGDYAERYPLAYKAFDVIRNDLPFDTYNNKVELALGVGDLDMVLSLLSERPGVFARRMDHVLRLGGGVQAVDRFLSVASKVSTPVLLAVYNHFKNRQTHFRRAFFPKGNVGKVQMPDAVLPILPRDLSQAVASGVRNTLVERFRQLPPLGKVWIQPEMATQMVPVALRSASKALHTITRGSRLPIPDSPFLRFFIWWKNGQERTDIDLSCVMLDDQYITKANVSYFDLRDGLLGCYHSGDITSAPRGACEFIDANLQKLQDRGIRYLVMCVNSFTQQPYKDLPECFAGLMGRTKPQSGEIFEARTVQQKFDLTSETTFAIPMIIDVKTREMIWADLGVKTRHRLNNINSNRDNISMMTEAMVTLNRPNLYDLFMMHAEARGEIVSREDAEVRFAMHEGVTPYDIDRILTEFLA
jgi:stress response protein SCP2